LMAIQSTWQDQDSLVRCPQLTKNIEADVVIVGGGITGIMTAYLLSKTSQKVVLLESATILSKATAYTTGFITQVIDTNAATLIKLFGKEAAKLVWQSGHQAIRVIESIVRDEHIDCDFVKSPLYLVAYTQKELEQLRDELAAVRQLGFEGALHTDASLIFPNAGYLEIPGQARFHPLKFLYAVAAKAMQRGVQCFEKSPVQEIVPGKMIQVKTAKATVTCRQVVVATYTPFNNPPVNHFKKAMYDSYILEASMLKGTLPEAMFVDMKNPYHYFRVDPQDGHDRILIGGEDHRSDVPVNKRKSFAALQSYLSMLMPNVYYEVIRRWTGKIVESVDGLPFIGEYATRQYLATAFSGNGMTYSVIAAMLFRDAILGEKNPWRSVYHPKRKIKINTL